MRFRAAMVTMLLVAAALAAVPDPPEDPPPRVEMVLSDQVMAPAMNYQASGATAIGENPEINQLPAPESAAAQSMAPDAPEVASALPPSRRLHSSHSSLQLRDRSTPDWRRST